MFKIIIIAFYLILFAFGNSLAQIYAMPSSVINYPGARATLPFVAIEPYIINIQGVNDTINLYGSARTFDYSGNVPFINQGTGYSDPAMMQAWDTAFASSFLPPLSGDFNLPGYLITNAGFPGRIEKHLIGVAPTNMTRYNAGNGTTAGCPRSKILSYAVPPLTHVKWELELSFGNADGTNDWILHHTGTNQVLFWQLKSNSQGNPAISANVDTDDQDSTKLMIYFAQRTGGAPNATVIGEIHGLQRHAMIPIVIEAFLDERLTSNGGMGLFQAWVNGTLVSEVSGPTLVFGTNPHWWDFGVYNWSNTAPYPYTMSIFFKTAKMFVFPITTAGIAETIISESFKAYPNPTSEKIIIEISQIYSQSAFSLSDINGHVLIEQVLNSIRTTIDISNLHSGVYFIKVQNQKTFEVNKIIIK